MFHVAFQKLTTSSILLILLLLFVFNIVVASRGSQTGIDRAAG